MQVWYEGGKRPSIGNHHAAEVIRNKLYLFGGLTSGKNEVQIGTLKMVSGRINISWTKGAAIPTGSGSAATAYIDGKVYVLLSQFAWPATQHPWCLVMVWPMV
jgi:hypothetical protein